MLVMACLSDGALADCRAFSFSLWQPAAERVVLRPQTLLSDFPFGGEAMAYRVTIVGASSRAGLASVLKSVPLASAQQRRAIAEGLVTAAALCDRLYPAEARRIELAVERSGNLQLKRDFRTAFQSELSREAQGRSERLSEKMQDAAEQGKLPASTGLFSSRNTGPIPGIVAPTTPR